MRKGNYCDSYEVSQGERINSELQGKSYEFNRYLIEQAQSECREASGQATERLVILNRGLVRSIALRFRDRGVEFEDIMQIGTIGLLKAIKSFDLNRGTCFSTYAVPMIFGEIRRVLRDEGMIRVGRDCRKLGIDLMRAKSAICERDGREPHLCELAEYVGVSPEEAAIALDSMCPVSSLSDLVYGEEDGMVLEDTIADSDSLDANERFFENMALKEAITQMPADWQKILILRYYRNKTQQQVADMLGLSQVKVSREEKKIVDFLRKKMK